MFDIVERRSYGGGMPGTIQSIERAAAALRMLGATGGPAELSQVAHALGLPRSTAHGILATLCSVGYVEREPGTSRYRLGRGLAAVRTGVDPHELRSAAMNWTDQLAARSRLEVLLGVASTDAVEVVHHVFRPDDSPQRLRVGEALPLHATALGQVLLAEVPGAGPAQRLRLDPYTGRTTIDPDALADEVAAVRARGHAVEAGEHVPDVAAVAAPVRHGSGAAVGAVAVTGPLDRLLDTAGRPSGGLVGLVTSAARAISAQLALR
jgi:DNA-binding IclR family transcriptional regulator